MEIKCTVEELIKIVSVKQNDTIKTEVPLVKAETIEKLNQAKNQTIQKRGSD